ncbi:MAG: hypothetical protein U0V56_00295 [Actinomycetota bacterium]
MTGRLDEARAVMEERRRTMYELGSREMLAFESQSLGWLEIVAGRFDVAERIFGEALEALNAMGSQTALIVAAFRAQACIGSVVWPRPRTTRASRRVTRSGSLG